VQRLLVLQRMVTSRESTSCSTSRWGWRTETGTTTVTCVGLHDPKPSVVGADDQVVVDSCGGGAGDDLAAYNAAANICRSTRSNGPPNHCVAFIRYFSDDSNPSQNTEHP